MKVNKIEEYVHDDNIKDIISDFSIRESKVVLWDADSIVHFVLYSGKNEETGERNSEDTEDDLETLELKLNELVFKVLNNVEKYYDIEALYIFIRGKNNFRKQLYQEYKANRPAPNPLISKLYNLFKQNHGAIEADGAEAEDYIYSLSKKINHQGIILYIDHDLEEIPSIMYNYKKDKWSKISEKEATYNLYKKLCIGETGDNVNFTPKIGIKYFEKNFNIDMSIEEYEKALYETYLKVWKEEDLAKEKLELAKQLISLKNVEELNINYK